MPTDWSARLDPRGWHVVSITRPDTASAWDGPTRTAEDGWTEGDAIVAYDPTNVGTKMTLRIGDAAYLSGPRKGRPAELALIEKFFERTRRPRTSGCLSGRWFYRPEHLKLQDTDEWEPRELFLCDESEETDQSACTLELTPVTVSELHDLSAFVDTPHHFFWRRRYELASSTIEPLAEPPADDEAAPMEQETTAVTPQTAGAGANRAPRRNEARTAKGRQCYPRE